ncbi:Acetyl esterase/lipase [Maribacter sedimenticola]|uniref:Acetyl esterase/lipase n=1 Tax=Maribacter sedimenticola TaxID=228956 RepID=A0ABY1SEE1_9FLAO|nr:alpha/beta hydrolase [Maribacter sedimenticola]SNR31269.1 Acetyl esterase/lipase [Maribacter sedimenticola]
MRLYKKTLFLLSVFAFFFNGLIAQNLEGVTGVRDTSYTTASAFAKDVKKYPHIKIIKEFNFETVIRKEDITYCTLGNRALKLDVFEPKNSTGMLRPAVIIIHGGGWRSGNRLQHYPLAEQLANKGYVSITPEYRLSTEALFPSAVYDLKAVVRWVRKNANTYQIDPEKIVISGFSAGGELAAFIGTTANKLLFENDACNTGISSHVNAIIDLDGTLSFVHPESGEGDDSKRTSAATHWFGYSKAENPILWKQASPLTYVNEKTPPTLFINSAVARMHAGREDYINILRNNSIYSEVISFETAPHSFVLYSPWFEPTVKGIDNFLKTIF